MHQAWSLARGGALPCSSRLQAPSRSPLRSEPGFVPGITHSLSSPPLVPGPMPSAGHTAASCGPPSIQSDCQTGRPPAVVIAGLEKPRELWEPRGGAWPSHGRQARLEWAGVQLTPEECSADHVPGWRGQCVQELRLSAAVAPCGAAGSALCRSSRLSSKCCLLLKAPSACPPVSLGVSRLQLPVAPRSHSLRAGESPGPGPPLVLTSD